MTSRLRIVVFALGLATTFGAAFGVGRLWADDAPEPVSYSLRMSTSQTDAQAPVALRFSVLQQDEVLTEFAVRHEKRLHLIAVRDDFGGYRHLHPEQASDGQWSIEADLGPGRWRLFADFQPVGGDEQVVDTEVVVPGEPTATPDSPGEVRSATVDGYTVELDGALSAGRGETLDFRVSRDGAPVTDLQPYLGAFGHLVVLRGSDMKYLHAHPEDGPAGPSIPFDVAAPSAERYHLYLDFKHGGVVRTAFFEIDAGDPAGDPAGDSGSDHGDGEHGDH